MQTMMPIVKKHLLVIDDEEDICQLVTDVGEMMGFSSTACSLLSNLAELPIDPLPDVLALDLSMPEVDGIEVIHFLGNLKYKPQLILMTGFERSILDGANSLARQLKIPVLGQLSKPFSIRMLQDLLAQPLIREAEPLPPKAISPRALEFGHHDIEQGLLQSEFIAYFQPQIELGTSKLHGAEALVRWQRPEGLIMPDDFLPFIENSPKILTLTKSMIEQTLIQMMRWHNKGLTGLKVSINLSAAYIQELDLPTFMQQMLKRYPIEPHLITFEITERIGLNDSSQAILDTLTRLRLKGFSLSIDDFGTGYSSLSQLNQLPFNEIKIDKSFVFHLLSSPISKAIVESSISLARQLNVRCVAEGVETAEIEAALSRMGCDIAQGYFYSKALPPSDFLSWARSFSGCDKF